VLVIFFKFHTVSDRSATDHQQTKTLCDVLSMDQVVYGHYTLKLFVLEDDINAFIEYGFARSRSRNNMTHDVIDEPLAILVAMGWLNKHAEYSFVNLLQHNIGQHAPRKNGFECYFAFYIRKVFEGMLSLNEVFSFRHDFALRANTDLTWQREKFELVTVSRPASTGQQEVFCCHTIQRSFIERRFRWQPTNQDLLDWISTNEEQFAFCFPPVSAGPDVLFFLRSKSTQKLLFVAAQTRNYQSVTIKHLAQGVRMVTPSWLWKSTDKKVRVTQSFPCLLQPPDVLWNSMNHPRMHQTYLEIMWSLTSSLMHLQM
jgi:hypothetical protein